MMKPIKDKHYLTFDGAVHDERADIGSQPFLTAPAYLESIRELPVIRHLMNLPMKKRCFVDAGAHIGFYAIPLANHFTQVVAYEPSRYQYAYLLENVRVNKLENIRCRDAALGESLGTATLHVMGRSGGSNTLSVDVARMGDPMDEYEVDLVAVDSEGLKDVDLIKVDVEGFEKEVLVGAKNTIMTYKPIILCEVWQEDPRRKDVSEFLSACGYSMDYIFDEFTELAFCAPRSSDKSS